MDLSDVLDRISKIADVVARNLPLTGQQLLFFVIGLAVLLVTLSLFLLLRRNRSRSLNANTKNLNSSDIWISRSLEELALDAAALEEVYQKGHISEALFLEEATALKRHADLLQQYLQKRA